MSLKNLDDERQAPTVLATQPTDNALEFRGYVHSPMECLPTIQTFAGAVVLHSNIARSVDVDVLTDARDPGHRNPVVLPARVLCQLVGVDGVEVIDRRELLPIEQITSICSRIRVVSIVCIGATSFLHLS